MTSYYAKEVFKRIDQPTSDNTEDSSDTDDTEESSGTNDSETDLSASQQNFVGLWEYTFTINRPGHFLFLSNGRGRVEPYSSGIVAGQDNMNGYWTYDTEKKDFINYDELSVQYHIICTRCMGRLPY